MSEQKLCWRCRQFLIDKFGSNYYIAPSNHCHHDESKEKPKEECWCDEPNFRMIYLGKQLTEVQFCPLCGKPKKDWGK
jgi:hypothetical protein